MHIAMQAAKKFLWGKRTKFEILRFLCSFWYALCASSIKYVINEEHTLFFDWPPYYNNISNKSSKNKPGLFVEFITAINHTNITANIP